MVLAGWIARVEGRASGGRLPRGPAPGIARERRGRQSQGAARARGVLGRRQGGGGVEIAPRRRAFHHRPMHAACPKGRARPGP
jgi:hypothetical protein